MFSKLIEETINDITKIKKARSELNYFSNN